MHPLAFCWQANNGPTLNACWLGSLVKFLQGILTGVAKEHYIYIFVTFQLGAQTRFTPTGSAHDVFQSNKIHKNQFINKTFYMFEHSTSEDAFVHDTKW